MQQGKKHNQIVESQHRNQRIDVFLSHQYSEFSRSYFQRLIRQGFIQVNSSPVKVSYKIEAGDQIEIIISPPTETTWLFSTVMERPQVASHNGQVR